MCASHIRNWDGSLSWQPEAIYKPRSEDEIVALIQRALERGQRVKAIGGALSWSDILDIPAAAILFDNMNQVLEVDRDRRRVRVQAGARLHQVNEVLAQHGLAFENFGSIVTQTAAGYIATGSHGTGARMQMLAADVEHMRLIDGLGQVHELNASTEPELFSAARVSLGCLGVISEITFRCLEAFDLEERLDLVDFDTALADLDSYNANNDYCKLWWFPYTDKIQVYTFNKTTQSRGGAGLSGFLDQTGISGIVFAGLLQVTRMIPGSIPFILNTLQNFHYRPHRRVDRSDKVIKVSSSIPVHQETEYAIPIEQGAKAIEDLRKMVLKANYRVNFPLEVRFLEADDIPLSPASGRDSCFLGPYVSSRKWAPQYFAEFEELMLDYEGRPHWGKSFNRSAEQLQKLYPALGRFDELRRQNDHHGLFRNSFVDRVFAG
jgi:L-gulonolactone oxidase